MSKLPDPLFMEACMKGAVNKPWCVNDAADLIRHQHAVIVALRQALWDATVIFEPAEGQEHPAPAWLKRAQIALDKAEVEQ